MEAQEYLNELIAAARTAQAEFASYPQEKVDAAVRAIGKAVYDHAEELANLAVEETRMGKVESKIAKGRNKSKSTWWRMKGKKSRGIIERDEENGMSASRAAEYIAAMITGFFVLFLAVELVRDSIEKLVAGEYGSTPRFVFIVLGASVVIKAGMFVFYRATAKKIDSDALRAAATDSICDCAATAAAKLVARLNN